MRKIRNIEDLRAKLREIKTPVVGIAVSAFNRIGIGKYLPNYKIISIKNSRDLEILENDFEILSLEKISGKRPSRNPIQILKNNASVDFLRKLGRLYLVFYKVTENRERVCDENDWGIIGNRISVFSDNKIRFRKVMEELGLPVIPGEIVKIEDTGYTELSKKYGKEIVVQLQEESGGKGTFFIRNEGDFERCRKRVKEKFGNPEVLVTKFIPGPSPSLTGCVTKHGVLYTNLQYQLLDITEVLDPKKGNGVFCGHDWDSSHDFPEHIRKQAYDYAERIGNYLKSKGYKGIFGLDMVMNRKRIYVVELNPRLLGSFPVLTMVQELNKEPILMGFHILEFLEEDYDLDVEEVNRLIKKPKKGAQLVLFNKFRGFAKNRKSLRPGVYVMENNELKYLRPGYKLRDLKERGEFILTDGVPYENTLLKPHERVLKILTFEKIMDKENYKLNAWAKKVAEKIYENLDLVSA